MGLVQPKRGRSMYLMFVKLLIAVLPLQLPYHTRTLRCERKLRFCQASHWEENAEFSADSPGLPCWPLFFSREAVLFTLDVWGISLGAALHMALLRCQQELKQPCLGETV